MVDLNVMMREQAMTGLQTQLDTAVTNGDTAAARRVSEQIAALSVQTAPKSLPFTDADVKAELDKQDWFGVDPKKSAKVIEYGKTMDPKKFGTAAAFAAAILKAVNDEFTPPAAGKKDPPENETDEDREDREAREATEAEEAEAAAAKKTGKKITDGPGEGDTMNARRATGAAKGPWAKLADAPADVQKEIKRTADKMVPAGAPKETREKFIATSLLTHYNMRNPKKK